MQQAQTGEENMREVVKEEKGENVEKQTENGVSQERKLVGEKKGKTKTNESTWKKTQRQQETQGKIVFLC